MDETWFLDRGLGSVSGFVIGIRIVHSGTVGIGIWFQYQYLNWPHGDGRDQCLVSGWDRSLDRGLGSVSGFGISICIVFTGTFGLWIGLWFGIGFRIVFKGTAGLWLRYGIGHWIVLSGTVGIGLWFQDRFLVSEFVSGSETW